MGFREVISTCNGYEIEEILLLALIGLIYQNGIWIGTFFSDMLLTGKSVSGIIEERINSFVCKREIQY